MKVIGGTARGRKLKVPKGLTVRPTAARVKESLFNILPHDFSGLRVLDLYAGSGNVSIEALSRGAVEAVLVDESARSAAVIRANLTRLELLQRAQVWIVPVARALRKLDKAGEKFDLIFLDPPYERGLVTNDPGSHRPVRLAQPRRHRRRRTQRTGSRQARLRRAHIE